MRYDACVLFHCSEIIDFGETSWPFWEILSGWGRILASSGLGCFFFEGGVGSTSRHLVGIASSRALIAVYFVNEAAQSSSWLWRQRLDRHRLCVTNQQHACKEGRCFPDADWYPVSIVEYVATKKVHCFLVCTLSRHTRAISEAFHRWSTQWKWLLKGNV